jgi:hypothetical protein
MCLCKPVEVADNRKNPLAYWGIGHFLYFINSQHIDTVVTNMFVQACDIDWQKDISLLQNLSVFLYIRNP